MSGPSLSQIDQQTNSDPTKPTRLDTLLYLLLKFSFSLLDVLFIFWKFSYMLFFFFTQGFTMIKFLFCFYFPSWFFFSSFFTVSLWFGRIFVTIFWGHRILYSFLYYSLCVVLCDSLYFSLSYSFSIHLSTKLYIYLSIYLSIYLFIYLFIYLYLFFFLSISLMSISFLLFLRFWLILVFLVFASWHYFFTLCDHWNIFLLFFKTLFVTFFFFPVFFFLSSYSNCILSLIAPKTWFLCNFRPRFLWYGSVPQISLIFFTYWLHYALLCEWQRSKKIAAYQYPFHTSLLLLCKE